MQLRLNLILFTIMNAIMVFSFVWFYAEWVNSSCNDYYMFWIYLLQLVKDIRRLVDSGEFLANRHCKSSPVVKLIITLLLEFITDHSREVKARL